MNEQTRRLRTGIFLTGGLLLVLIILFFLGGRDLFTRKIKVCTYFEESVQGLSRGAAVKYRGAPIGTVSDIRIIFSKRIVRVDMEIEIDSFSGIMGDFRTEFMNEVRDNGLRCRLEYLGITGLKFIDFDYRKSAGGDLDVPASSFLPPSRSGSPVPLLSSTSAGYLGSHPAPPLPPLHTPHRIPPWLKSCEMIACSRLLTPGLWPLGQGFCPPTPTPAHLMILRWG